MRAIVIKQYGGPDVLAIEERPAPETKAGHVTIEVKAFGLNHAEIYFRTGVWGDVAEISGIECVGTVKDDPDGRFKPGETVLAVVGGMGRSLNGSYAELVSVPASNVAAVKTDLQHFHLICDLRAVRRNCHRVLGARGWGEKVLLGRERRRYHGNTFLVRFEHLERSSREPKMTFLEILQCLCTALFAIFVLRACCDYMKA